MNERNAKTDRKQIIVLFAMLVVYALCAFLTYTLFADQLATMAGIPLPDMGVPDSVVGLANAGIVLVLYGILGLAGYWFARKIGLPGIFREAGNFRRWALIPLGLGALCGLVVIIGDSIFANFNDFGNFPHPGFPLSLLASLSAGIGEEIAFRGFVFGLWGLLLNWALRRYKARRKVLWIANIIAALAFGAGHLGSAIAFTNASTITDLNPLLLVEILLFNGVVGLVAGDQYIKEGLVAAAGVHFWTDIFWHVLWGLTS